MCCGDAADDDNNDDNNFQLLQNYGRTWSISRTIGHFLAFGPRSTWQE